MASPASWTAVLWGFLILLVLAFIAAGIVGNLAGLIREAGSASAVAHSQFLAKVVNASLIELLMILALTPFWVGGAFGSWGSQIAGEPAELQRFWPAARASYGRGWGVLLYAVLFAFAALTVYVMLRVFLPPVRSELLMMVGAVLALPWAVRLLGGLFVRRVNWLRSTIASVQGWRYPALLGGVLLAAVAESLLFLIALAVERVDLALGGFFYVLVLAGLSVAIPVWYLSLYEAERRLAPPDAEIEGDLR